MNRGRAKRLYTHKMMYSSSSSVTITNAWTGLTWVCPAWLGLRKYVSASTPSQLHFRLRETFSRMNAIMRNLYN